MTSPNPWWSKSAASTQGLIPRSASMIPGSVRGSASLPGRTVPPPTSRSISPKLLRGDRAADELERDRLAEPALGPHVAGDERVDVAGDEDDVADPLAVDVGEQLLALGGVALPRVELVVGAAEHLRRHHHHLVADHLPGRLGAVELALDPGHLIRAEQRPRLAQLGAAGDDRVAARLVGAVAALVEHEQVERLAEAQLAVDPVAPAGERRHRLEPRLVTGRAARAGESLLGREPAAGRRAGVVVLDLVVVPDDHHRGLGVERAQRLVAPVERVLRAVVGEADGHLRHVGRVAGAADRVVAHRGPAGERVVGLGVDVVAEADDEVEVLARHHVMRVVEAVGVVLAGEERERELLAGVGGRRGPEAADGALAALRLEAVEVLVVGLEPGHARLDAAADLRPGGDRLARDDVAEALVARDLEPDAAALLDAADARPQRHRLRARVARRDALRERARAEQRARLRGARGGEPQRLWGEDRGSGGAAADQELPA